VDDRVLPQEQRFGSQILPRYLRRVPSVDNLIPILYLKGVSSGDMSEALASILGPGPAGLSATNIVRLRALWEQDYQTWNARDFELKRYVYFWVDGIHFDVRLDEERSCILVIMGANESGRKELLAVSDGYAESKASWREILLDLKRRGLKIGPKLAVGDGALGFWSALREVYPGCREQRCWVHKTANVLDTALGYFSSQELRGNVHRPPAPSPWSAPATSHAALHYQLDLFVPRQSPPRGGSSLTVNFRKPPDMTAFLGKTRLGSGKEEERPRWWLYNERSRRGWYSDTP
jgi:hypothetical protein